MNRVIMMKDRRLIEALDYIDDEYIASAALYKMRAYAESARPLAQTAGQSVKKHWKHYLGFVACLLVLALATPLFTHLPEIINSFASAGGTEDETTNGMYDEYILTEEDLAELNEAYFREITSDGYYSTLDEAQLDKYRATIKFASTIEQAIYRPSERPVDNDDYAHIYIGKYGECIAVAFPGSGLSMEFPSTIIKVCYNSEFYSLTTAQDNGYLTDSEAEMIRDFIDTMFAEGRYDKYILTEDDLAQINEAYLQDRIADMLEDGCEVSEEDIERMKNSKYSKYALTVDEAMQRIKEDSFYFGKFGDCFIFKIGPGERPSFNPMTYILGEYKITIQGFIRVVYNYEWIHLSEAYERGLLSDKDVAKLYEVYCKYYEGDNKTE